MGAELMDAQQAEEHIAKGMASDSRLTADAMILAEVNAGRVQLDRIEAKLDQVIEFNDTIMAAVAPYLTGKGKVWLAMLAKARGGGG